MDERIKAFDEKMQKTIEFLEEDYASIRAGRANPHLLDKIKVDYYGTPSGLNAVANISVPEARIIQIQPWEAKMVKEISKAILASDLGITPTDDGRVIRLVFPELTEDRRKELAKDIKKKGENAKVAEAIKKIGKSGEISEDVQKQIEDEINKMTEKYCDKCDKLSEEKTKEIMTV